MSDDFSKATPRPWLVERHDQDDGSISYEIWHQVGPVYHRIVTLNDADNETSRSDARLIVAAVNERDALREALGSLLVDAEDLERMSRMAPGYVGVTERAAKLLARIRDILGGENG